MQALAQSCTGLNHNALLNLSHRFFGPRTKVVGCKFKVTTKVTRLLALQPQSANSEACVNNNYQEVFVSLPSASLYRVLCLHRWDRIRDLVR